jgi:hypothetical protein
MVLAHALVEHGFGRLAFRLVTHQPDISDADVLKATGRSWQEWLELLAAVGMAGHAHSEVVDHLREAHGIPAWWQRAIADRFLKSDGASRGGAE